MPLNLDRYNQRIVNWTRNAEIGLKAQGNSLGIVHRSNSPSKGASLPKVKGKEHYEAGGVDRIGFKMNRSLVWTHKGAGKGKGGTVGSSWTNRQGEKKETASSSLGKMGTGNRKKKPWFDEFMNAPAGVEDLATIAAEELGDAVIADTFKIK
jgi:hypothetical protein